jgi:hypothetical protein
MFKNDKVFRTALWVILFLFFSLVSYSQFFNYPEYPRTNFLYSVTGGLLLSTAVMLIYAIYFPPSFPKHTTTEETPHGDFSGTLYFDHNITIIYEHSWIDPIISHPLGVSGTSLPVNIDFGNSKVSILSPVECSVMRIIGAFSIIIKNEFRQVLSIGNLEEK